MESISHLSAFIFPFTLCILAFVGWRASRLSFFLFHFFIFFLSLQKNRIRMASNADKIEWTLIFATEFGRKFGLTLPQAFDYLSKYQAIDFIDRHYDYVHTQSFASMVDDLGEFCRKKGGYL